jgi:peroxiredoxin
MKKYAWSVAVLALAWNAHALELGGNAPATDVKMKNVDGKEVTIGELKGEQGTLVIFSCNHCPFVKAWEERIARVGNDALKKKIGVVQINSNDPKVAGDTFESMQERAKDRGFKFPYVVDADSSVARAYGASKTPEVFLFNKDGVLVYHGTIDDNYQKPAEVTAHYLQDAIDALATDKDIATKETKILGCGIKFRGGKG